LSVPSRLRRAGVAASIAVACALAQAHGDEAAAAARLPARVALLQRAQAELERGDATQALDDFERASMMLHAADAELGQIRAAMQDGQYRRALAFCAHTAGEHTDDADGAALYAWLLRIGGQGELAARTLADARAHAPDDPVAAAVASAFEAATPQAGGVLLAPLHRMAPWPVMLDAQAPPPADARFAGNAALLDGGALALVPISEVGLGDHARVWVRNGLGQTTQARVQLGDRWLTERGLALLKLCSPIQLGVSRESGGRAPFAGSPGYAMSFGDGREPAWPSLTQGFLGGLVGDTEVRRLGFEARAGAPVFDAKGALAGITVALVDGRAIWLPLASALPSPPVAPAPVVAPASRPASLSLMAPDEVYEAGMRRVLQVLIAP
jgi:hypothetical protein